MKTGILTYHDTTNYGAVLQAYALQEKINNLGSECEIIDYKCEAITDRYKIIPLTECKNIKQFIKSLLTNKNNRILMKKFKEFNEKYQKLSSLEYNKETISQVNDLYDCFITGSDQVWNLELSNEDTTYMLDFVTDMKKKKSYAASFGYKEIPDKYVALSKKMLGDFETILVREEQGKSIIEKNLNRQAKVTIDPTLLLNKTEWDKLIENGNKEEDYILLYIIAPNKEIINFAKRLAKKEKCKIIYLNHSYKDIFGVKNIKTASPEEFLKYVRNAKYVVTTSFHGVAFSVNFEKQFFYALSKENGNFNSRIENLVNILNLKERIIGKNLELYKNINYDKVNYLLENERKNSIDSLKEILGEKNDKE